MSRKPNQASFFRQKAASNLEHNQTTLRADGFPHLHQTERKAIRTPPQGAESSNSRPGIRQEAERDLTWLNNDPLEGPTVLQIPNRIQMQNNSGDKTTGVKRERTFQSRR